MSLWKGLCVQQAEISCVNVFTMHCDFGISGLSGD